MSVLIKGMDMPTNCTNCPCSNDESRFCRAAKEYIPMMGKPEFCPLIPVPTHGRLIDASEKIIVQMYDDQFEEWQICDMTIDDLLCQEWVEAEAPTVIPAEEVE